MVEWKPLRGCNQCMKKELSKCDHQYAISNNHVSSVPCLSRGAALSLISSSDPINSAKVNTGKVRKIKSSIGDSYSPDKGGCCVSRSTDVGKAGVSSLVALAGINTRNRLCGVAQRQPESERAHVRFEKAQIYQRDRSHFIRGSDLLKIEIQAVKEKNKALVEGLSPCWKIPSPCPKYVDLPIRPRSAVPSGTLGLDKKQQLRNVNNWADHRPTSTSMHLFH